MPLFYIEVPDENSDSDISRIIANKHNRKKVSRQTKALLHIYANQNPATATTTRITVPPGVSATHCY